MAEPGAPGRTGSTGRDERRARPAKGRTGRAAPEDSANQRSASLGRRAEPSSPAGGTPVGQRPGQGTGPRRLEAPPARGSAWLGGAAVANGPGWLRPQPGGDRLGRRAPAKRPGRQDPGRGESGTRDGVPRPGWKPHQPEDLPGSVGRQSPAGPAGWTPAGRRLGGQAASQARGCAWPPAESALGRLAGRPQAPLQGEAGSRAS